MANPSKDKGTAFETAVVRYMRARLKDERIERRALHGAKDMGDVFGIRAHGFEGIAECKAHATVTPSLIERWRDETLDERGNADADFALLVVKRPRKSICEAACHVTVTDLTRIIPPHVAGFSRWSPAAGDCHWVQMTLGEACSLIGGEEVD